MTRTSRSLLTVVTLLAAVASSSLLFPRVAVAQTTFYVDARLGLDSNDGTSQTVNASRRRGPWKTVARVHSQPLAPGDVVRFKRGEVWREILAITSSGAPGRPVTIGAYGSGPLPVISGADVVGRWSLVDADRNIYSASVTVEPGVVYVGATRGTARPSAAQLTTTSDWYWSAGLLYLRSVSAPGNTVEAASRGAAVVIAGHSHITLQDLLLERTNGSGLYVDTSTVATSGLTVERVTSRGSRHAGMAFKNGHPSLETTNVQIRDNTVYENGASGINVSEGVSDITIARNTVHHNSWSSDTYQAGIRVWAGRRTARNLVVEYNETHSTYFTTRGWESGHGIWIDEVAPGAVVRYNASHDNGGAGIFVEHSDRARVYYNVVVNNRDAGILLYRGVHGNEVTNNTVYGGGTGIRLAGDGSGGSVTGNLIRNNIAAGPLPFRLMAGDGGENDGFRGYGNVYLNNAFGAEASAFIVWGYGVVMNTYAQWETAYGGTTRSVRADPLFVSPTRLQLRRGSPCARAGIELGIEMDIVGTPVPAGTPPDLGAFQGAVRQLLSQAPR